MAVIYDSITVDAMPADPKAIYLGYIDGYWPTFAAVQKRFPNNLVLSVTTNGFNKADICDVESGDATPEVAAAGVKHGLYSTVYCARSNLGALVTAMSDLEWHWFCADWTGVEHLVPGSVATQWADPGTGSPGNYDISITNGVWPNPPAPKPVPNPVPSIPLAPDLELIVSLATSPADALNFVIRDKWATYRTDTLTVPALQYVQAVYNQHGLDATLAFIIDNATVTRHLRPQFVGAA